MHPFFILFFLWFLLTGKLLVFVLYSLAVIIHEFGHHIVAKKLGYKLDRFYLSPYHGILHAVGDFADSAR